MTTHAQEAAEWLEDAPMEHHQGNVERAKLCTAMAQARATLALAEQQRIANLIALADFENPIPRSSASEPAREALTVYREQRYPGNDGWVELRPEIAEALGIEQDS